MCMYLPHQISSTFYLMHLMNNYYTRLSHFSASIIETLREAWVRGYRRCGFLEQQETMRSNLRCEDITKLTTLISKDQAHLVYTLAHMAVARKVK